MSITLSFDSGTLLLSGLGPHDAPCKNPWVKDPWMWDSRVGKWRCEAIHYPMARQELAMRYETQFEDAVPQPTRVQWPKVNLLKLRSEQQAAIDGWEKVKRRGQIIMPTGTGKTEVALEAMRRAQTATLIVAPVRDLMYQWHRRILQRLGLDAGIIGDNQYTLRPVCVTTYDSAYIHMPEIGARFGLIIFDEEHHLPGQCRREAALFSTAPMRIGLTATPERSDGRHQDLDELVGPVAYQMPFQEARGKTLAEFDVVRIPVHLSDEEQRTYDECSRVVRHFISERRKDKPRYTWQDVCKESGEDPAARHAMKAYHIKQSIEDRAEEKLRVLEDIFRLHVGQKTIIFAGSNSMAMDVSRRFLLPTILSHTPKRERHAVLDGFAGDDFPVLVANRVLDEGVDVPEAKVAVIIGGQSSTRQAQQRLGRILRRSGIARARLYEVVCEDTKEVHRSRKRRRSDAYERTRHRKL